MARDHQPGHGSGAGAVTIELIDQGDVTGIDEAGRQRQTAVGAAVLAVAVVTLVAVWGRGTSREVPNPEEMSDPVADVSPSGAPELSWEDLPGLLDDDLQWDDLPALLRGASTP